MAFLHFLEGLRSPVLNEIFLAITELGGETAFLVLALIFFWCVDKRRGYYIMAVGFIGTIGNQLLKMWFRIPRPWVRDESFTAVEAAKGDAGGYSFPSGHTQTSVGTFGSIAATGKNRIVQVVCIALAVLVGFSRMYLGVHTPADVIVGAAMALALVLILKPVIYRGGHKGMKILIAVMIAMAIGMLVYVEVNPAGFAADDVNYLSGLKNAYTMMGCLIGVAVVYFVDYKYLKFETDAIWLAQIIKAVLGLGVVLAVKEGLRGPLEALMPVYPARAVRYFLIVIAAGILWPMTFKWFAKMGKKVEEAK